MARLYELAQNYTAFFDAWENGDIPEEAVTDTLEAMEGEIDEKCDNTACYIKDLIAQAANIKEEIKTLTARAKALENRAERLKDYMVYAMDRIGASKIETARNVIKVSVSHPTVIRDEAAFLKWAQENGSDLLSFKQPTPDKTAIKDAIAEGREVPFCYIDDKKNICIK